jgi:hypothetical protein
MSAPIFISYSSKDQEIAETIGQALEARGLQCWISSHDVHAGENFQEAIVRALRSARVMVLVFTTNANNSDEIKKELVLAGRHQVTVIPVRVEDVAPNDAFAYEFATRQWIDLFKDWEREIESLCSRISQVLETAKPGEAGTKVASPSAHYFGKARPHNRTLLWSAALVAVVIIAGAGILYQPLFKPKTPSTAAPAQQIAAQSAAPVPPAPPTPASILASPAAAPSPAQTTALAPPPPPASVPPSPAPASSPLQTTALTPPPPPAAPQSNSDEVAWQTATSADNISALDAYLKQFPGGTHVQDAQLKLADLIIKGSTPTKKFDGSWETMWSCANVGQSLGYSYRFVGEIKDGVYHGLRGTKGQRGSFDLNGKIEPDGKAAFFGEIIVNSSVTALGAAPGTASDFHVMAQFEPTTAAGTRIEGRPCSISFAKQ